MKVKTKFNVVFVLMMILITIETVLAFYAFNHMGGTATRVASKELPMMESQLTIRRDVQTINKRILLAIYDSDNNPVADQKADFQTRFASMSEEISHLKATVEDTSLTQNLDADLASLQEGSNKILEMAAAGNFEGAQELYRNGFNEQYSEALANDLDAIGKYADELVANSEWGIQVTIRRTIIGIVVFYLIVLVLNFLIFGYLAKYMSNAFQSVMKGVQAFKNGDYSFRIDTKQFGKDDVGVMAENFNDMGDNTGILIDDMGYVLSEMANGNFAVQAEERDRYVGDFQAIVEAFDHINAQLKDVFVNMNDVAKMVESGSASLANGSMALSQGSTEQASTIEELSATIRELSVKIQENSKNADEVRAFTGQVSRNISEQNMQMHRTLEAMKDIESKSNQIENIIKTIDDFSFQTNILALNASVEAARAGSAGKGFAVVADEVRNLAGKSAAAAAETGVLIQTTIEAIRNGAAIVTASASSMEEVIGNAQKSSELVTNIADEMQREATSIAEVTNGLEQISVVVAQNSETAEQSSASCEELNSHAAVLKSMVDKISY